MASAVNADHADTADTASNALKLGGYDASDYLRKDEVQTVTASYTEIEWTTPETTKGYYEWVVPKGVNKILVTSVGAGGGYGYRLVDNTPNPSTTRYLMFPGGSGGEIVVQKEVSTTPGEILRIYVGAAGANVLTSRGGMVPPSEIKTYSGKNGGDGGMSYIARNGTMISETKARGGAGGYAIPTYSGYFCQYNSAHTSKGCYNTYPLNNRTVNTNSVTSKYPGGQIANHYCANGSNNGNEKYIGKTCWVTAYSGTNSNYASGGNLYNGTQAGPNNHWYPAWDEYSSWGQYLNSGGGGSWGAGGSCDGSMRNGQRAGIGGGGAHYLFEGQILPGHGMIRILAIGLNYED